MGKNLIRNRKFIFSPFRFPRIYITYHLDSRFFIDFLNICRSFIFIELQKIFVPTILFFLLFFFIHLSLNFPCPWLVHKEWLYSYRISLLSFFLHICPYSFKMSYYMLPDHPAIVWGGYGNSSEAGSTVRFFAPLMKTCSIYTHNLNIFL